ncbi:ZSC20 protein, partial [Chauna torquata]|nr:ZSC20 protein [Chauna torquata]
EQPHKCSDCGKSFDGSSDLVSHQQFHQLEKRCECPDSRINLSDSTGLRTQSPHKPEKFYLCSECGKCFGRRSNLNLHKKLHTGERPHQCPECGLSFTNTSHLIVH